MSTFLFTTKIGQALSAGLLIAALVGWIYVAGVRQGEENHGAEIKEQNDGAINEADQRERDFARCISADGVFDFATGKCTGARSGGG